MPGTTSEGRYPELRKVGVTVLDKLTYCGRRDNLEPYDEDPRLRFVQGDITDGALVDALHRKGHDRRYALDSAPEVDRLLTFTLERGRNASLGPPPSCLKATVRELFHRSDQVPPGVWWPWRWATWRWTPRYCRTR